MAEQASSPPITGNEPSLRREVTKAASQAPEVVAWHRRLLGSFHVTGVFWYRFHLFGATILPDWLKPPLVAAFTVFFYLVLFRVRRAVLHNLEHALGSPKGSRPVRWLKRQARAFRTIHNHAWCLTETYEGLSSKKRSTEIEFEGHEYWQQLLDEPRGFILLTAHVGHWEVGSRHEKPADRRVHVVREPELDAESQAFLRQLLKERSGDLVETHFSTAGDLTLGLRLLKALRRGDLVALQGDRARSAGRCQRVTLFGRPFELPLGPAVLARAAGVALLPVFVFRRGRGKSTVVFRPPIRAAEGSDLVPVLTRIAREIENAIRREPYQWFCFKDLWGDLPAAETRDQLPSGGKPTDHSSLAGV